MEELERMSSTLLDIVISSINTASQSSANTVTVALLQTLVIFSQVTVLSSLGRANFNVMSRT